MLYQVIPLQPETLLKRAKINRNREMIELLESYYKVHNYTNLNDSFTKH